MTRSTHALRCAAVLAATWAVASGCGQDKRPAHELASDSLETIYVLRSIREAREAREAKAPDPDGCDVSRTGFEPASADAERFFSFWSLRSGVDGQVVDARQRQVGRLRGCFGPTADRARQNFHAEIELGELAFRGRGECLALLLDQPEPGLFPVRCQLVLDGLPAPYVGGLLTTNTLTSRAALGGDSDPPGYTQASIATIRLWKARTPRQP
jgi:hypothetical protein